MELNETSYKTFRNEIQIVKKKRKVKINGHKWDAFAVSEVFRRQKSSCD